MTPQRLLPLLAILATLLAGTLYVLLAPTSDPAHATPVRALGEPSAEAGDAPGARGAEGALVAGDEPSAAAGAREARRAAGPDERAVEVRVVLPRGAPADPGLRVVALPPRGSAGTTPERVDELLASGGATAAPVGVDGTAVLVLARDVGPRELVVDGRYLLLDEPRHLPADASDAVLRPRLGACVVVRVAAPLDGEPLAGEVALTGADLSARRGVWRRRAQPARAGELVFRAVDADTTWTLLPLLERHHAWARLGLELEAGRDLVADVEPAQGVDLTGVVVDEGGSPVAGVDVRVPSAPWFGGADGRSTTSDERGAFELLAVAPGEVRVEAAADGWRTARGDALELADGERRDGLRLVLSRGAAIAGVVHRTDGRPAAGAEVVVESSGGGGAPWMGGGRPRRAGEATAGDDGRFRVTGLEDGTFAVRASLVPDEALAPRWRADEEGVRSGREDLALVLAGPVTFTGRVVDDRGQPVRAFQVVARAAREGGPSETQAFEDEDGRFAFERATPGAWRVEARADGHVSDPPVELVLPHAGEELELGLARASRVAGRVVDPTGAPVAGATVRATDGGETNPWGGPGGPSARSDETGRFELERLAPGDASFTAEAEGWADSEPVAVALVAGSDLESLLLALRVGGRIEGVVSTPEGTPLAGRRVTWGSNAMGFGSRGETRSDASGRFAFAAVTPGQWAVSASPGLGEMGERMRGRSDPGAWIEVMGELLTETVTVADGEVVEVYLGGEPRRPVRVFGTVTRAGEPLPGARVFAVSEGNAVFQGMKSVECGADGSYELVVDRPGPHVVSAALEQVGVELLVDVPRADETRVDLAIPLGGLAGRVRRDDGDPAPGVRLSLQREDGLGRVRWSGGQTAADADGRYAFESLEPGVYTVRANVATFGGAADEAWGAAVADGVVVARDAVTDGVDFKLERAGAVEGVVQDPSGTPLAGAGVFVRDAAGRVLSPVATATTGAGGRFRRAGLAPGEYTLSVRGEGVAANDAARVVVQSGETSEVRLSVEAGVTVRVALEDPDGAARRARVEVLDGDGREVGALLTQRQLRALFNEGSSSRERVVGPLPPGRYTVRATTEDGRVSERRVTLRERDEEKLVRLRLDA